MRFLLVPIAIDVYTDQVSFTVPGFGPSYICMTLVWDEPGARGLVDPIPGARSATVDIRIWRKSRRDEEGPFPVFIDCSHFYVSFPLAS